MGRRASVIYGGIGLGITMFLIGGSYASGAVHPGAGAGRWLVIVMIYIFVAIYGVTWAISMKIYVVESQPQRTRASATSIRYRSNWITDFIVALVTPILLARSSSAAYFLFGGCSLLTVVVCLIGVPETKGNSLKAIERAFEQEPKPRKQAEKI